MTQSQVLLEFSLNFNNLMSIKCNIQMHKLINPIHCSNPYQRLPK